MKFKHPISSLAYKTKKEPNEQIKDEPFEMNSWFDKADKADKADKIVDGRDYFIIRPMPRELPIFHSVYKNPVSKFTSPKYTNGFELFLRNTVFKKNSYDKLIVIWSKPTGTLKFEEFEILCGFCSDWYKMDEHGERYGGFWKYPEDSYEYINAYELSYKKNTNCLWNLPWPKHFLIHTVKQGCNSLNESVRYSNSFGEMMYRSIIQYEMGFMTRALSSDIITKILEY